MHIRRRRLTPQGRWRMVTPSAVDPSRAGDPPRSTADTAGAALYLLSDEAAYVTGANIPVSGGWGW